VVLDDVLGGTPNRGLREHVGPGRGQRGRILVGRHLEEGLRAGVDRAVVYEEHAEAFLSAQYRQAEQFEAALVGRHRLGGAQLVQPAARAALETFLRVLEMRPRRLQRGFSDLDLPARGNHGEVRLGCPDRNLLPHFADAERRDLDLILRLIGGIPLAGQVVDAAADRDLTLGLRRRPFEAARAVERHAGHAGAHRRQRQRARLRDEGFGARDRRHRLGDGRVLVERPGDCLVELDFRHRPLGEGSSAQRKKQERARHQQTGTGHSALGTR
jgi:hypothetical protein